MRKHKRSSLFAGRRSLPLKIAAAAALFILILIIIIPSNSQPSSNAEMAAIRQRGALRVAVSSEDGGFMNDDNEGLEADISRKIATYIFGSGNDGGSVSFIHVKPSFMDTYFSDASVDIAVMQCPKGLYPSKYTYSEPYYTDRCLVIIKRDADAYESFEGMTIGCIANSICESKLKIYAEKNKQQITVQKFPTYELMLNALQLQQINACVMPGAVYKKYASNAFRTHDTNLGDIEYSVVCSSENSGLITAVNNVINDMKSSGELDKMIQKYLGERKNGKDATS